MNFLQFQKALAEAVRLQAKEKIDVRLQTITKNNGIRRRAMEISAGRSGLYPSIYMEPYYTQYQNGMPVSQLADHLLEQCEQYNARREMPRNFFLCYTEVRGSIFCKLINYEKNQKLLQQVPHTRWNDLALVSYYQVDSAIIQDASILISREHVRQWNISEKELLEEAWRRTCSSMKPVFRTLGSVLQEMNSIQLYDGVSSPLYLLTNENKTFGAVLIADETMQRRIGEWMQGDYYVLPSSIHECLILAKDEVWDEAILLAMVREINRTQVAPQEVLSDNLYYYDCAEKQMLLLTGEKSGEIRNS